MNAETGYIRSSNLSDKQRQFLSQYTIDPEVQRLIPSSTISDSVDISSTAVGLLLSHQPLVGRFYWDDFTQLSLLINRRLDGYVTIFPSGYDYDLTHTLFFLSLDNPERSIPTSELTFSGVELTGACTFERDELGVFLEAVHKRSIRDGTTKRRFAGGSDMVTWLAIETPSHDYFEPAGLWLNKPSHEEYVASLRSQCSLHLYSGSDIWIRTVGMDWPEYFFRLLSKGMWFILAGNSMSITFVNCILSRNVQNRWKHGSVQPLPLLKGRATDPQLSECIPCIFLLIPTIDYSYYKSGHGDVGWYGIMEFGA